MMDQIAEEQQEDVVVADNDDEEATATIAAVDHALEELSHELDQASRQAYRLHTKQTIMHNIDINDDDKASFQLGLDLFGNAPLQDQVLQQIQAVRQKVPSVLRQLQEQPPPATTGNLPSNNEDLQQKKQRLERQLSFLEDCHGIRQAMDASVSWTNPTLAMTEQQSSTVDYVQAVQHLVQAIKALEELQSPPKALLTPKEHAACQQIKQGLENDVRKQRLLLVRTAQENLQKAVQLDGPTIGIVCQASPQLAAAWTVLQELHPLGRGIPILEVELDRLRDGLMEQFFLPVLDDKKEKSHHPLILTERTDQPLVVRATHKKPRAVTHRLECEWNASVRPIVPTPLGLPLQLWKERLENISTILTFVCKHVLMERQDLCQQLGLRLFGLPHGMPSALNLSALGVDPTHVGKDHGWLMETIYRQVHDSCVPGSLESPTQLEELLQFGQTLGETVLQPFVDSLQQNHLLPPRNKAAKLLHIGTHMASEYIEKRRLTLLVKVRSLCTKEDYHNTLRVGVDSTKQPETQLPPGLDQVKEEFDLDNGMSLFFLHESSVSTVTHQAVQQAREIMDEAVRFHTFLHSNDQDKSVDKDETEEGPWARLVPTLYKSARDCFTMVRTIIPIQYAKEIMEVPRTAAVWHNDCVYMSHHCMTLGLEYKKQLTAVKPKDERSRLVSQYCHFVDMVPLWREHADQSLGEMLHRQKGQLEELMLPRMMPHLRQSLASNTLVQEWTDAETALEAAVYHLKHLASNWKSVLSVHIYQRSMGFLADVVLSCLWEGTVTNPPKGGSLKVTPTACSFLIGLYSSTLESIGKVLSVEDEEDGKSQTPNYSLAKLCPRMGGPVTAIAKFWAMSLGDLETALAQGVFAAVEGGDLARLIRATHPHQSPRRAAILAALSTNTVV